MRWDLFASGLVIFILGVLLFIPVNLPGISALSNYILNVVTAYYYELACLGIIIVGAILMLIGFFSFKMGKWFKYY
jgi:hypothetical protein